MWGNTDWHFQSASLKAHLMQVPCFLSVSVYVGRKQQSSRWGENLRWSAATLYPSSHSTFSRCPSDACPLLDSEAMPYFILSSWVRPHIWDELCHPPQNLAISETGTEGHIFPRTVGRTMPPNPTAVPCCWHVHRGYLTSYHLGLRVNS